ncbi:sulfite exporter TauE/SafE family protein [Paramicrobacterium agarici]|uniref:sulfite exporter TauE/SafE family protein n=1 Tax=Paramicrobacterium agarici TaxID=630514 RepID=UPI0011539AD7|nr:sulfite exporter TauE/SafE family protein [Microbacterium agarici]TQO22289.1 hypothetical protein FB385_1117 [Microbacterium agarici]
MPSPLELTYAEAGGAALLVLAIFAGAIVQGSTGFGIGLVAAPLIGLVDTTLIPSTLILVTVPLPLLTGLREMRSLEASWLGWALVGRVPGSLLGAVAVGLLSSQLLSLVAGSAVLIAVAASLWRWQPTINRLSLVLAGGLSGLVGTSTSIGSPPMALLMQSKRGAQVRSTLGLFFFTGTVVSLFFLTVQGQITHRHVAWALALAIPMLIGFLVSGKLRRFVDNGRARSIILSLVAVAAATLILTAIQ